MNTLHPNTCCHTNTLDLNTCCYTNALDLNICCDTNTLDANLVDTTLIPKTEDTFCDTYILTHSVRGTNIYIIVQHLNSRGIEVFH